MKLKAALDSEVMTKLLVAVRFAAENKSASGGFQWERLNSGYVLLIYL